MIVEVESTDIVESIRTLSSLRTLLSLRRLSSLQTSSLQTLSSIRTLAVREWTLNLLEHERFVVARVEPSGDVRDRLVTQEIDWW